MFPYLLKKKAQFEQQGREMQIREMNGGSAMPEIGDPFSSGNPNGTHASNVRNEQEWNKRFKPFGDFLKGTLNK